MSLADWIKGNAALGRSALKTHLRSGDDVSASVRASASLKVPSNNIIAQLGDSRPDFGRTGTAGAYIQMVEGFQSWLEALSLGAVTVPPELNFGVAGDTSDEVLVRVPDVVASGAGSCVVLASTNDRGAAAYTFEQTVTNMTAIIEGLRAGGVVPIVIAEAPRQGILPSQMFIHLRVVDWFTRVVATWPGVVVVDVYRSLVNPLDANGSHITPYYKDGVHFAGVGGYLVAKAIKEQAIDRIFPKLDPLLKTNADVFDVTSNIYGNLLTNGLLTGTGGSKLGTTPTPSGDVADGCFVGSFSGSGYAIAASKVTRDGVPYQRLDMTGTPSASRPSAYFRSPSVHASVSEGDIVEAIAEIRVDAGTGNYAGLRFGLCDHTQTTDYVATLERVNGTQNTLLDYMKMPTDALVLVARTPRFTATAGITSLCARLQVQGLTGQALTVGVEIGRVSIRKVP